MRNSILDPKISKKAKHIAWYTNKVAELGRVHPTHRTEMHDRRARRLLEYKKMLNRFLMEE